MEVEPVCEVSFSVSVEVALSAYSVVYCYKTVTGACGHCMITDLI